MASNKQKEAKEKRVFLKPQESTQMNIPIKDVYNGIAINKDKKCVKILEIKPQPFFLKKIREQNRIISDFEALLKIAPDELHIKAMSVPTDMNYQISEIKKCVETEPNADCKNMGQECIKKLEEAQENGISRRFFISFPYKSKGNTFSSPTLDEIVFSLNNDATNLERSLNACGNEVIVEYPNEPNMDVLKPLYMVYNRDSYLKKTFENRVSEINARYLDKYKEKYFYIPIQDYIAPEKMSFVSYKYLVVNNTYYSFLYIPSGGYNPVVYAGWITRYLTAFRGVDVDIFLKRVPREFVINGIKRSIGHSRATAMDSSDVSDSYENSLNTLGSAQYLKNGLSVGNDFYYMSTIITVSGTSAKEVSYKMEQLKMFASQDDVTLKENIYRVEETFNMVLPTSTWNDSLYTFKKTRRNVLTEGAASLYPFTTTQLVDKEGLYIGDDNSGSPVVLDQFNRKRVNNQHIFIAGETGSGKTTTLMLIALRARVKKMPVYIIAPEKQDEYKRITNAIGGQFIDIGAGSNDRINIMEIFPVDERSKEKIAYIDGDGQVAESYLIRKVSTLSDFFSLAIPNITPPERYDLEEAIIQTYAKFGITSDNNSLWADEEHTHYKKMPTISDLIEELKKHPDTTKLSRGIGLLTKGNGEHFNGQTNVNVNNNFVVIGLQHNSEDMIGLSIYMAMDFCSSKIMEDRTKNKFFIVDESWKMLMNPISANKLMAYSKLLRAYSCSMIIATQNPGDVFAYEGGKYGTAVLNNCATKMFMALKEHDAETLQDIVDLTNQEAEAITKFKAGQALLLAGETRLYLTMKPSETEQLLTFTDRETLERYVQLKRRSEEINRFNEMSKDATDLDEIFDQEKAEDKAND